MKGILTKRTVFKWEPSRFMDHEYFSAALRCRGSGGMVGAAAGEVGELWSDLRGLSISLRNVISENTY